MGGGENNLKAGDMPEGRNTGKARNLRKQCVWRFSEVSTTVQRRGWYSQHWVLHPAKMPVPLARAIIETYTSPGDLILDPMAGFFTTGIEAGRMGRLCLGVELERKYVDAARRSIEIARNHLMLFDRFLEPIIVQGDAQHLPLDCADVVVTSPPYSEGGQGQGKDYHPERMHGSEAGLGRGYADKNEENIGNLRHGNISAVLMSPPYQNRLSDARVKGDDPGRLSYRQSLKSPAEESLCREKGIPPVTYSNDKKNIGTQRGRTYLSSMVIVYQECLRVLRPGALLILVLKNFVRNKKIVRLDLDTRKLCEAVGFTMVPCPEGCEDQGHTHLRSIERHSFWLNDLIKKWKEEHGDRPCPYEQASSYEQIQVYRKAV